MAVGGMPQAIETFLETNNLEKTDNVKQKIIELYKQDLKKIDPSGRLSDIYSSVPEQLASKKRHFSITAATGKKVSIKDQERIFALIDSQIVLPCYNVNQVSLTLTQERKVGDFKLYLSDIGLFTSLIFSDVGDKDIYKKLLSDKLCADLGYLYENAMAQIIASEGRSLYYHSWRKNESTHSYEVDFIIVSSMKIIPIEVKSSSTRFHASIDALCEKYSNIIGRRILFSQKDVSHDGMLEFKPIYMAPFLMQEL